MSCLRSKPVSDVLERIAAADEARRAAADQRFRELRAQPGAQPSAHEAARIYRRTPMAVRPEVGELLYLVTLARRASRIVEFGMSFGSSTNLPGRCAS